MKQRNVSGGALDVPAVPATVAPGATIDFDSGDAPLAGFEFVDPPKTKAEAASSPPPKTTTPAAPAAPKEA